MTVARGALGRSAARHLADAALAGAALAALAVFAAPAAAQVQERPRLEAVRVAGEVVVGGYAGIGGFIVGRFVAEEGVQRAGASNETTIRNTGYIGGIIGGGLATAGVVYAIGSIGDQTGDFDATALGTGVGFVAALGLAKMVLGPEGRPRAGMSTKARWVTANVIAMLPAVGASIGFNSTRRQR